MISPLMLPADGRDGHPRAGLAAGAALLLAANAPVLAGVARNRSGPPEARLALSERELWIGTREIGDDTGRSLRQRALARAEAKAAAQRQAQPGRPSADCSPTSRRPSAPPSPGAAGSSPGSWTSRRVPPGP